MAVTTKVVSIGDNCVDHYLPPIDCRFIGGNALNVAVQLCKSGIRTAYVGNVGEDREGKLTLEKLHEQGVDISHVQVHPGRTSTTDVLLTPGGDRQFIHEFVGPLKTLNLKPETLNFVCQHDLVHNSWMGGTEEYLLLFKQARLVASFDYGERYTQDYLDRTIAMVDVAFFSTTEEEGQRAREFAEEIGHRGPSLVVITMGRWGSLAYDGSHHFQPAFPAQVVDTLGAGDTFIGVFLAHRMKKEPVVDSLRFAAQAAAHTCTHYGAWEGSAI